MATFLVRNFCKYQKHLRVLTQTYNYSYHSLSNPSRTILISNYVNNRQNSTNTEQSCKKFATPPPPKPPTLREKLKQAVAQYGVTVVVFHTVISLTSLGFCYVLVSSGLDVGKIMTSVGISDDTVGKIVTNAGTFTVAYAIHKMFAPLRIATTLTVTPFLVRHLRRIGILKTPKNKNNQLENKKN